MAADAFAIVTTVFGAFCNPAGASGVGALVGSLFGHENLLASVHYSQPGAEDGFTIAATLQPEVSFGASLL